MSDMRKLREALKTREALAPDPDAVLAGAHGRIRRRRTQRRVAGAAAAVAVVIAGAGAGMSLLRPSGEPESIEAAAGAADLPVPAPALPFTVDNLPPSLELSSWTVAGGSASGRYEGYYGTTMEISVSEAGPDVADTGTVTYLSGGAARAQLRIEPGKVVTVVTGSRQFPEAGLLEIVKSVRLVPTPVHSMLRTLRAPAGLTVRQWSGGAEAEYLTLCPAEVPLKTPARTDGRCYEITVTSAGAPVPITTKALTPLPPGKTVRRLLNGGTVLTVSTELGAEAVMEAISTSAVGS
ncbi:hypothetical protein CF166_32885 [Amycolatopsis sp. KNN50.9b]|nr:hypothetical protein CF166_32885 [Amycolatopsis sp. KNN50.9b]